MRGDKKRFPLVLLIAATLFATLGLTSLASMQDQKPAVAAQIAAPASARNSDPMTAPNPSEAIHSSNSDASASSSNSAPAPATAQDPIQASASSSGSTSLNTINVLSGDDRPPPLKFSLDEELRGSAPEQPPNDGTSGTIVPPRSDSIHSTLYIVTAYFLNVRANPYNGSKVLRVVERGTELDVIGRTEKGWLRLQGGGYVHGGYAEPLTGEAAELLNLARSGADAATSDPARKSESSTVGDDPDPKDQASEEPAAKEETADPASLTNRVNTDSGLTEAHIARLFEGTALAGHGIEEVVLEIEDEYGINALFTVAVMKLESGNGKSKLSRTKNNLFGLNATSGDKNNRAFSFKTKGDSVRKFGQLLADKYVEKGLTTVDKVARKYCPASSSWAGKVKGIMKSDYRKL